MVLDTVRCYCPNEVDLTELVRLHQLQENILVAVPLGEGQVDFGVIQGGYEDVRKKFRTAGFEPLSRKDPVITAQDNKLEAFRGIIKQYKRVSTCNSYVLMLYYKSMYIIIVAYRGLYLFGLYRYIHGPHRKLIAANSATSIKAVLLDQSDTDDPSTEFRYR
jgi:hypothetical protein